MNADVMKLSAPVFSIDVSQLIQGLIAAGSAAPVIIADLQQLIADAEKLYQDVAGLLPGGPPALHAVGSGAVLEAHGDRIAALCHVCNEHAPPHLRAGLTSAAIVAIVQWLIAHPQYAAAFWSVIEGFISKPPAGA